MFVDYQMQLEAEEPSHRGLTPSREVLEHLMLADTAVVADLDASCIDEADACTPTEAVFEIGTQRQQDRRHPADEALVAHQLGKGPLPVHRNVFGVEVLKRSIALLMESDRDSHHFAEAHLLGAPSSFETAAELLLLP